MCGSSMRRRLSLASAWTRVYGPFVRHWYRYGSDTIAQSHVVYTGPDRGRASIRDKTKTPTERGGGFAEGGGGIKAADRSLLDTDEG